MYLHEVGPTCGPLSITHYAERSTASGLSTVHELGHTVAITQEPGERISAGGIYIANEAQTRYIADHRSDKSVDNSNTPRERIECEDIDAFKRLGVERWQQIIDSSRGIIKLESHLWEKRRIIDGEKTTAEGIVIPNPKPDTEFVGYNANADEVAAIEYIVESVQIEPLAEAPTGSYL